MEFRFFVLYLYQQKETIMETFFITVSGNKIELELTANKSTWNVYCRSEVLDFNGSVFNGHYNYNETGIVMYIDAKEWKFFEEEIRTKVEKILRKLKIIKTK